MDDFAVCYFVVANTTLKRSAWSVVLASKV